MIDARNYLKLKSATPSAVMSQNISLSMLRSDPEDHLITKQDRSSGRPQSFDAFVLYDEEHNAHTEVIQEIVKRLEIMKFSVSFKSCQSQLMKNEFFYKLCIKERDFLMGIEMEHDAVLNMIANRCHRVIVFVTKGFLLSRHNLFISQFCQRQSIGNS